MSTENSPLIHKLRKDYEDAQNELAQSEERTRLAKWKLQYIKTLLESAPPTANTSAATVGEFAGMTIGEVAIAVLNEKGEAMSAMDIARRAMAGGFDADNIERARSHISAVISKDINSAKPRFRQMGRGAIGLVEWVPPSNDPTPPKTTQAKLPPPPQPFGDEESFKDEDIPF